MDKVSDEHKISELVENLTSKLYYHGHPINRKEAKDLGLKIARTTEKIEKLMWDLYLDYETEMLLDTPFRPLDDFIAQYPALPPNEQNSLRLPTFKGVYIESLKRTDTFTIDFEIIGQKLQNLSYQMNILTLRQGWQVET